MWFSERTRYYTGREFDDTVPPWTRRSTDVTGDVHRPTLDMAPWLANGNWWFGFSRYSAYNPLHVIPAGCFPDMSHEWKKRKSYLGDPLCAAPWCQHLGWLAILPVLFRQTGFSAVRSVYYRRAISVCPCHTYIRTHTCMHAYICSSGLVRIRMSNYHEN